MTDIPIAHIDDEVSISELTDRLRAMHGPAYDFDVFRWDETTDLHAQAARVTYAFVVRADDAMIRLYPGDRVRGGVAVDAYCQDGEELSLVTKHHLEPLWPGDVFTVGPDEETPLRLFGQGVAFRVVAEESSYAPPRLALLRNLVDKPGGCASYAGAFRREALPPDRTRITETDARGTNRVNEHTLDMRIDRTPPPSPHFHGPVATGSDTQVTHSETAIVLPRGVYGLPEVDLPDTGSLRMYPDPVNDPGRFVRVPVSPGSIVVTPATADRDHGPLLRKRLRDVDRHPWFCLAPLHDQREQRIGLVLSPGTGDGWRSSGAVCAASPEWLGWLLRGRAPDTLEHALHGQRPINQY